MPGPDCVHQRQRRAGLATGQWSTVRQPNLDPFHGTARHHSVVPTFVFPVEGLTAEVEWQVGPTRLRPGRVAISELRQITGEQLHPAFDEGLDSAGAVIEVEAGE